MRRTRSTVRTTVISSGRNVTVRTIGNIGGRSINKTKTIRVR
jgi:hypothetical protein